MSAADRRHFARLSAGLETTANNGQPPSTTANANASTSSPPDLLAKARAWHSSRHAHRAAASTAPAYTAYFSLAARLHKEKWTVQDIARFLQENVAELKPLKLSTLGQGLRRHLQKQRPKAAPSAAASPT